MKLPIEGPPFLRVQCWLCICHISSVSTIPPLHNSFLGLRKCKCMDCMEALLGKSFHPFCLSIFRNQPNLSQELKIETRSFDVAFVLQNSSVEVQQPAELLTAGHFRLV